MPLKWSCLGLGFGSDCYLHEHVLLSRYIRKEKVSGNDGDTWVLDLAERALDEKFKTDVQTFIGNVRLLYNSC